MVKRNKLRGGFDMSSITGAASEWTNKASIMAGNLAQQATSVTGDLTKKAKEFGGNL